MSTTGAPQDAFTPSSGWQQDERQSVGERVRAITREIIRLEQEADAYTRKCGQFTVEESAWRSVSCEAPLSVLLSDCHELQEKLLAARQDLDHTTYANDIMNRRIEETSVEVYEELEACAHRHDLAASECSDLRVKIDEEERARSAAEAEVEALSESRAGLVRAWEARQRSSNAAAVRALEDAAAVEAHTEALAELGPARDAAAAALTSLESSEEALARGRRMSEERCKAASSGLAERHRTVAAAVAASPANAHLQAAEEHLLESCKRRDDLLNQLKTWQGICESSHSRVKAAESRAERACRSRDAAKVLASEAHAKLDAAKLRIVSARDAKAHAEEKLQATRFLLRATNVILAFALFLLAVRLLVFKGQNPF